MVFALGTARRMLPLVRRVVGDLLQAQRALAQLQPEKAALDRRRRTLDWPARSRRYQLREEIDAHEEDRLEALAELEAVLGLTLLDQETGRLGFPTLVNDRRAFFSWQPDEEGIDYWHFEGEKSRRLVPRSWMAAEPRPVHQS
jgi:hypothetical protein